METRLEHLLKMQQKAPKAKFEAYSLVDLKEFFRFYFF